MDFGIKRVYIVMLEADFLRLLQIFFFFFKMSSASVFSWITDSFWDAATVGMPELVECTSHEPNFKPFLPELQALDEVWTDEVASIEEKAAPIMSSTLDHFAEEYLEAYYADLDEESHVEDELSQPAPPSPVLLINARKVPVRRLVSVGVQVEPTIVDMVELEEARQRARLLNRILDMEEKIYNLEVEFTSLSRSTSDRFRQIANAQREREVECGQLCAKARKISFMSKVPEFSINEQF